MTVSKVSIASSSWLSIAEDLRNNSAMAKSGLSPKKVSQVVAKVLVDASEKKEPQRVSQNKSRVSTKTDPEWRSFFKKLQRLSPKKQEDLSTGNLAPANSPRTLAINPIPRPPFLFGPGSSKGGTPSVGSVSEQITPRD